MWTAIIILCYLPSGLDCYSERVTFGNNRDACEQHVDRARDEVRRTGGSVRGGCYLL